MNLLKAGTRIAFGTLLLLFVTGQIRVFAGPSEVTFDTLKIGTHVYTNVTVTTRTADYVFILHSAGMNNIKVSELSPEVREELGYAAPKKERSAAETAQTWAKETLKKVDAPQVKAVQQQLQQTIQSRVPTRAELEKFLTREVIIWASAVLLVLHLFFSFCCALICVKAGRTPGWLVWIPLLQLLPLLRAAKMSGLWFFAYFVPVLNLVAQVILSFKIAEARGKSVWVGVLLLLPVLNLLAFLYLAFSNGATPEKKGSKVRIMTLETA